MGEENRSSKELVAKPAVGTKGIYKIKLLGSDGKLNTTAEMELEVLKSNKGEDNTPFIIGGSVGGGAIVIVGIVAGIVIRKRRNNQERNVGNLIIGNVGNVAFGQVTTVEMENVGDMVINEANNVEMENVGSVNIRNVKELILGVEEAHKDASLVKKSNKEKESMVGYLKVMDEESAKISGVLGDGRIVEGKSIVMDRVGEKKNRRKKNVFWKKKKKKKKKK